MFRSELRGARRRASNSVRMRLEESIRALANFSIDAQHKGYPSILQFASPILFLIDLRYIHEKNRFAKV